MKNFFMRDKVRFIAIALIAFLFVSFSAQNPIISSAEENLENEQYLPTTDAVYFVNPLYAGLVSVNDLYHAGELKVTEKAVLNAENKVSTVGEAAAVIREKLKNKDKNVYVYFELPGTNYDAATMVSMESSAFNMAMQHTGKGDEGDYLKWGYSGMGMQIAYNKKDGKTSGTFTFYMTYYTTAAQEQSVNAKVKQISNSLSLASKGEYDKILAVYNYVCDNVRYDNSSQTIKYTCYSAAINNSAVCQGYSLLVYRLLNDAGVDCRFVAGNTSTGGHGWNIVRVGSYYYNIDATWDAGKDEEKYSYFMKSDKDFDDHTRWSQYLDTSFTSAHPMSQASYNTGTVGSFISVKSLEISKDKLTIKAGSTSQLKATVKPAKFESNLTWKSSDKEIASVDSSGKVKGVSAGTCTVTVSAPDGKKETCYVTVTGGDTSVKSIKLNKKKLKIKKGKKFTLVATITPTGAKDTVLVWKSSNKKVAKITNKGVVKAKGKGKCTITVSTKDGKKKATCKVTVK
ncbi:Ig-like domain-containing protein [Butyrivibrio sp. VCD2006]|uniref:Ig-like domain-containing protein n=1 Tax=Butyrivibrio sp. VCD2006 TaxID=1280664 RepID=UPI000424BB31|nr:Ig-like domain-containing protein [Butyrivibrio sp. VCD2006]